VTATFRDTHSTHNIPWHRLPGQAWSSQRVAVTFYPQKREMPYHSIYDKINSCNDKRSEIRNPPYLTIPNFGGFYV
jgi:hypothetical protein